MTTENAGQRVATDSNFKQPLSRASSPGLTGRSSIAETVLAHVRRHGVLDAPHLRSMTVEEHDSALPRHDAPGLIQYRSSKIEGAGKAGCPMHPQPRTQKQNKRTSIVHHRFTATIGLPCAMVLTAYPVLSSATNSSCHRHLRIKGLSKPGWAGAPPQT